MFRVNTDGSGYTALKTFAGGSDGSYSQVGLTLSGNTLFGTTMSGGDFGGGTVFKINSDGNGYTVIKSFAGSMDGAGPQAGVTLSGSTLYGTTIGGFMQNATIFSVRTDGSGFTNFAYLVEGSLPNGNLVLSDHTVYGMTQFGGYSDNGTVFAVNTDGSGFRLLHSFTQLSVPNIGTNSDGSFPIGTLILLGNTLFGTAAAGGTGGGGTVFSINTNGTGFTTLHSFSMRSTNALGVYTNSGGFNPYAGLISSGNTLYGTTALAGSFGSGTVFAINTDGSGFTVLHNFTAASGSPYYTNSEGAGSLAGLVLSGNTLFGTAEAGGSADNGTVFSVSFPPQMTINSAAANIILTWPTNYSGFDYTGYNLQSATNLDSQAVWTTASPGPVVVNGLNTVTNPISGAQKFYRLIQ